jgi:hypothetical protein
MGFGLGSRFGILFGRWRKGKHHEGNGSILGSILGVTTNKSQGSPSIEVGHDLVVLTAVPQYVVSHLIELQRPHWSFVCINTSLALVTKDEHPKLRCRCKNRVTAVLLRVRVTNEFILISQEKMSAF